MKKLGIVALITILAVSAGCGAKNEKTETSVVDTIEEKGIETEKEPVLEEKKLILTQAFKGRAATNPVMTQAYGADPFVMVYKDTAYIYMTADAYEYDEDGNIKENSYSKIRSIHVLATKDMKNFEDFGEVIVGGEGGAAKWAKNSWAPAAAWKTIDGKDKFFLYFADNGGGIGVLEADSPVGPFHDPIGKALISRDVPTCAEVLWLFDPAVLVDDDGTGYIYFGGGVPQGKDAFPGTGRVAKLGADMVSLDGDPVALDVPCLFEDSGIHKFNNKYYYTYCTNWSVPEESKKEYGFEVGEIACMVSDSPMGPFTYQERILKNPGTACGLYGNNHHAVFTMGGKWYIAYHSRALEKSQGIEHGYRITYINEVDIKEDGTIGVIAQSEIGPDQLCYVDPFSENSAVCVAIMAGTNAVKHPLDKERANLVLGEIDDGDYIQISGVDFGEGAAKKVKLTVVTGENTSGKVHVRVTYAKEDDVALLELKDLPKGEEVTVEAELTKTLEGVQYLFFVFEGKDYTVKSWCFE